jgi:hypothetical protein
MPRPRGSKNKPKDTNASPKARKPRAAKAESPKAAAQPRLSASSGNAEFKRPNPDDLIKLVKQICSRSADQKALGMQSKELIDKMAETKGLDKKAFGIFKALWKLGRDQPAKLAITLPHLLSYIDDGGLPAIADGARGLSINGEDDDDSDDNEQTDIEDAIGETTGAESTVDAMAKALKADSWDNSSPRLSIVPGPNAPIVPSAPDDEAAA